MTPAPTDLLGLYGSTSDTFAAALDPPASTPTRAAALTCALKSLWPAGTGWGVALRDALGLHAAALDAQGRPWADFEASLLSDRPSWPGETPVVVESLCLRRREWGRLAIASADPSARAFAAHAAPLLAVHLALADGRVDLAAEAAVADVGELAGPLMHDVTNAFNNLQLNLMVLEQGAGDLTSINFGRLRSRMDHVTALVREVQEYRRSCAPPRIPVDVRAAAEEALAGLGREDAEESLAPLAITTDFAAPAPAIQGTRTDVVRCFSLVFRNGMKCARGVGAASRVRTAAVNGAAEIRYDIPGLIVPVESTPRLYDTLATVCPQVSTLELATAKTIARRFDARISAECPAGGLSFRLEFGSH